MSMARRQQRTIAAEAVVRGIGFLSGSDVCLRFKPAAADAGIRFVRADVPGAPAVPAHVRHVVPRQRRTTLEQGPAVVEMVEHVMAALAGLQIDNCTIELDAPDTPGCDGSSQAFVEALTAAGAVEQSRPRPVLAIDRPVTVRDGQATLTAHPGEADRLVISYNLDYGADSPIGVQSRFVAVSPESFRSELAPSRTFLLEAEAEALRRAGVGSRTAASDLLVFGADGPIDNTLRFPDECVRHKLLDLVGDLALAGVDLAGHVVAHRSGHHLNAELVRALLEAIERDGGEVAGPTPEPPLMDIGAIMAVLPHRYPFLLIDRVVELEPGKRVHALKNVTCNEPFFAGHWPERPIMPGVLILEALAQAAGILIAHWAAPASHSALIAAIDDVKIRRPIVPGDQLRLEVAAVRSKGRFADFQGRAQVGDQVAAEARFRFVITPTAHVA